MYNTCCISMILNIKCKTHNRYNLYYAIILYKYYTMHFLCSKCGIILTTQTNINEGFIVYNVVL